jgi:AcrR family transcriptional regulator
MTRVSNGKIKHRFSPRERILAAAEDLFISQGIRGVGVEAIAQAADTNKMAIYRHFGSKDELVAQWLRQRTEESYALWDKIAADYPGDARSQLVAWIRQLAEKIAGMDDRGCPFCNSLAELPLKKHPARKVIEDHKLRQRKRFLELCNQAGIHDAQLVADELFFLLEGVMASAQSIGAKSASERLIFMAEKLISPRGNGAKPVPQRRRIKETKQR